MRNWTEREERERAWAENVPERGPRRGKSPPRYGRYAEFTEAGGDLGAKEVAGEQREPEHHVQWADRELEEEEEEEDLWEWQERREGPFTPG